jgi:hypothetical protein
MFKHFMLDFGLYFVGLVILLIVISNCWQRYTKKRKFSAPTLDTLGLTGLTARAGERQSKENRPADFPWYYVWFFFCGVFVFRCSRMADRNLDRRRMVQYLVGASSVRPIPGDFLCRTVKNR